MDQRVNADIAILDMGVGPNNDLNIAGGVDCTDSSDSSYPTYNDVGGHGTHVAGIAAAIDNTSGIVGVAPGARIWSVRVLGAIDGSWSWVLCGIDWVTAHASTIDVANMSLGEDLGNAYPDLDNLIHNAIKQSVAAGVTYVVAAGNAGTTALKVVPAKYSEVIAVSAFCDSDGKPGGLGPRLSACADDAFANFSNFGSVVDISAPGVDTRSLALGGGISVMSGTSFSTPHVAGAAALYIAQFGRVGPAAVRAGLMAAKEQGVIPGDTDGWNEGRLNVGSLVAGTVAMGHGSGPVGDSVTVKISNFPANASVNILFDSKTVATATTDGSGAVWRKITIPDATRGSHKITAISGSRKRDGELQRHRQFERQPESQRLRAVGELHRQRFQGFGNRVGFRLGPDAAHDRNRQNEFGRHGLDHGFRPGRDRRSLHRHDVRRFRLLSQARVHHLAESDLDLVGTPRVDDQGFRTGHAIERVLHRQLPRCERRDQNLQFESDRRDRQLKLLWQDSIGRRARFGHIRSERLERNVPLSALQGALPVGSQRENHHAHANERRHHPERAGHRFADEPERD